MSDLAADDKPPVLPEWPAPEGDAGKQSEPTLPPSDKPPGRKRGRPPGSTNKSLSIAKIEEGLARQFTLVGMFVLPFNEYDGTVIIKGTPALAKSIADLCEKNPSVRKNVERLLVTGTYGELVIAAGAIAIPIMANHGLMPSGLQSLYGPQVIPPQPDEPTT